MLQPDWNRLPGAYRRWPILAGVSAGLLALVILYLGRMIYYLYQGDRRVAAFSVIWSAVCLGIWRILHNWAKRQPVE